MGYNVKCIDLSHDPRHPPAEEVVYQELFDNTNYRYADLKERFIAEGHEHFRMFPFFDPDSTQFEDTDDIIFAPEGEDTIVLLKPGNRPVNVKNDGETTELEVDFYGTVRDVKDNYFKNTNNQLLHVSIMGTELMDDDMLVDHLDPNQIDDSLLVGSLKINIADENCDTQHAMTVQPFSRVHEVKEQYAALSNRIPKRSDLKIKRHDDEGYEASELHDDTTMWEAGVNEDDITLYYSTPPFSVTIKEMDEKGDSHDIEVEDHFTIAQVKEIYSKEAYEGLVEADSLVYANDELDERKALYKYNVKEGAVLFVQREDISQIHTVYICADCGADVTLKKEDYIRCTHCGYRILYKKRTAQVCQYLAR